MVIRFARAEDLPLVNELRRQVNDLHVSGKPEMFRSGFDEALQQHVYDFFAVPNHDIIVAECEQRIVGFACVRLVERPATPYKKEQRYLDVDEFGVDEGCRRQGIGRALFDRIRQLAEERDVRRIELNMWEFNGDALKFYEAIGFGTYRRYMEYIID